MNYPRQIQTRQGKFAYHVFRNLYFFQVGKDKVIGRPFTFVPELAGIYILLKFSGIYSPSKAIVGVAIGLFVLLSWVSGYVYSRMDLDRVEQLVSSERNMLLKEIHECVRRK